MSTIPLERFVKVLEGAVNVAVFGEHDENIPKDVAEFILTQILDSPWPVVEGYLINEDNSRDVHTIDCGGRGEAIYVELSADGEHVLVTDTVTQTTRQIPFDYIMNFI